VKEDLYRGEDKKKERGERGRERGSKLD